MPTRLAMLLTLMLVLQSMNGLLFGRHVPHTHILVGGVTPEQLRTHIDEEARAVQIQAPAYRNLMQSPVIQNGGLILSLFFRGDILSVPFQIEIALLVFYLGAAPFLRCCHAPARANQFARAFSLFDPPPRSSVRGAPARPFLFRRES